MVGLSDMSGQSVTGDRNRRHVDRRIMQLLRPRRPADSTDHRSYFGLNGCLAVSFLAMISSIFGSPFMALLDGQLGGLVVVLVDLGVVLGVPVDEDAADDDEVLGLGLAG